MSVRSILFGPEAYEPHEPHHVVTDDAAALEKLRQHGAIIIFDTEALRVLLRNEIEAGRLRGDSSDEIAYTQVNKARGLR